MDSFLDDYWDPDAAASYVKKTTRTLKAWRDRRIGPPVTYIGGKPYYRKESLKRWLISLEGKPLRRSGKRGAGGVK